MELEEIGAIRAESGPEAVTGCFKEAGSDGEYVGYFQEVSLRMTRLTDIPDMLTAHMDAMQTSKILHSALCSGFVTVKICRFFCKPSVS